MKPGSAGHGRDLCHRTGELKRKVSVDDSVGVTKGAKAAIEAAGGKVA